MSDTVHQNQTHIVLKVGARYIVYRCGAVDRPVSVHTDATSAIEDADRRHEETEQRRRRRR
ncbi:hypothetical protein [Bradyrhizobium sp. ORS 86]|uniref:hypothetical protein n=1 Tax=Bradyrhizobium sp. ORS 86 TaxID=1685970 RepID=UPI00388EC4EC